MEKIRRLLNAAYIISEGKDPIPDEAWVYYAVALTLMQDLIEEIAQEEGQSVMDRVRRGIDTMKPEERAGALGALGGAGLALFKTGGLGFGIATGGGAFGVAGVAGGVVASGGVGLAGAAALYLAYKGLDAGRKTELGENLKDRAAGFGRWAKDRFKRDDRDEEAKGQV